MFRVAILQFPGTNCEYETRRQINAVGLQGEFVRWNQADTLHEYDAYILPGGFAYEDRSRAGIIAAQDPVLEIIRTEAHAGKPVIGICNGCQILVETGLIPGIDNDQLAGAVAMNTRVKDGKIIGTGFYHDTVYIQNVAPTGRSAVTMNVPQGHVIPASVANGEGRFIFSTELLLELEKHHQILFKYCTAEGDVLNEFPTTPNGAMWGIAGLCNRAGNVVAYMPHPERLDTGEQLFSSLKTYLESPPPVDDYSITWQPPTIAVDQYDVADTCVQLFVDLKIADNAAKTIELALQQKGYQVTVTRKTHWEIWNSVPVTEHPQFVETIVQTGELLNTNKETYTTTLASEELASDDQTVSLLVRYMDDYEGKSVTATLQDRFNINNIDNIRKGVVWQLHFSEADAAHRMELAQEILQTYVLYNPYAQECKIIK